MKKVIIVKEPNLLWDEIIYVLQGKLPHYSIESYRTSQFEQMMSDGSTQDIELLIIDTDTNVDFKATRHFYKDKDIKIAIWTPINDHKRLIELFKLGFDGYLFNESEEPELILAVESIIQGKKYVHPDFCSILLDEYIEVSTSEGERPADVLTPREWDVLGLIVKGFKNKEIADRLFVSNRTVNNHIASILKKLNVPDKTNAAILAIKNKWFMV